MNVKYDWDWLLDGRPHTMHRVDPESTAPLERDEFDTNEMAFRNNASQAALKRGLRATVWTNKGSMLVVQAYDPAVRKRPVLGHSDIDLDKVQPEPPAENLCTVCHLLVSPLEIAASQNEIGHTECWLMDGWNPIGPKHET